MRKQLILISILLLVLGPFQMIDNVKGEGPSVSSITIDPEDPNILDDVNITISLTEPASKVEIEYCLEGPGGLCFPPEEMSPLGSNMIFSYEYAAGTFENASFHFNISIHHDGGKNYFEFHITVRAVPTSITLTDLIPSASDTITVFPESNITISGRVIDDLQFPVEGAETVLGIRDDLDIWSGLTDDDGRFQFEISFEDNGSYTLDLSINDTSYGLKANASWMVMVNSWPVPAVSLDTQLVFDPKTRPPGVPEFEFFVGSKIILEYTFRNTGTGTAFNFTVNERVNNTNHSQTRLIGNLSVGFDHRSNISLPTEMVGEYILELNCSYDQIAPQHLKMGPPFYSLQYKIIEKPTWERHRVLIEMFTQSTCVPCVAMEEAIERLHSDRDDDFEFIMYELDDQISKDIAQARGVTGTPHVFVDHGFDQIRGGGEVDALMTDLDEGISNAAARNTPPITISLLEGGGTVTLVLGLSDPYNGSLSGYAVLYAVESYSNKRNNQGIPLMNRFLGEAGRLPWFEMVHGQDFTLDVNEPPPGQDLVAVVFDSDGNLIQVKRTHRSADPVVYLKRITMITDITGTGSDEFNVTVEAFSHEEEASFDISFDLMVFGILPNLRVEDGSGRIIGSDGIKFQFIPEHRRTLDVGRTVHWIEIPLTISSSVDGEGTSTFRLNMLSLGSNHTQTIVVRMARTPEKNVAVLNMNLIGEGDEIFFTTTVMNIPPGAILKGRVQPCTEDGPGGSCGMPVEIILDSINETFYKGPVTGLVLDPFEYLTFKLFIIMGDDILLETQDEKVLISDLIDVENGDGHSDPAPDPSPVLLIVFLFLIGMIILSVIIFTIRTRNKVGSGEEKERPADGDEANDIEGSDLENDEVVSDIDRDIPLRPVDEANIQDIHDEVLDSQRLDMDESELEQQEDDET
ncbi:MAG: hypothetical protein QCI82_12005 [Candidatus Thermoplasmatota archaeon]|nr:hypothetical protein [Candidatus Thermoplasmatota archaeon]